MPVWNWHIKYLCDELQKLAENVFQNKNKEYDLIINISPGSTKSTICSIMFPAWIWTRMPTARIIGASFTSPLALDLSRKGRDVVKSEKYRQCFPNLRLRDDQDTKSYFMNTKGGSRYAVGVGGSVTGMHGHFLIVDDPLDPNKAISEAELTSANRWMKETLPTRKVNKLVAPTILIMQRLHQNDCTASMIEQIKATQKIDGGRAKLKHICLPAEVTDKIRPTHLRKYYKKGLMDPVRLSNVVLAENKAAGDYTYAGQFLQHPIPLGGGSFKTELLKIRMDVPYKWIHKVRYWDKAATAIGRGAYSVGLLMGLDRKGRFWILDVIRKRWDTADREAKIKQTAEIDGYPVHVGIEQEPGSGGKDSAIATATNLAGWVVHIDRPSGGDSSKELRADPYSVQVNSGNVYVKQADWNIDYITELSYFPHSTYKDQVDASSGAFNMLTRRRKRAGALDI